MLKKLMIIVVFVGAAVSFYAGGEEKVNSAAVEVVKMTNSKEIFQQTFMASFDAGMKPLFASGKVAMDKQMLIKAEALAFAEKIYNDPELIPNLAAAYSAEFTEDELKGLIKFYKTPLGKKTLEKMPKLFQMSANLGQRIAMKHQAEFQAKIQQIMMK